MSFKKRSECRCSCHSSRSVHHVFPCCHPDDVIISKSTEAQAAFEYSTKMVFSELIRLLYGNERDKGFNDDEMAIIDVIKAQPNNVLTHESRDYLAERIRTVFASEKLALITSEVSELLEGNRKPGADEHCPDFTKEEIEWADTFIRLFTYAGHRNLRATEAVMAKMTYNKSRPPMHGKKF